MSIAIAMYVCAIVTTQMNSSNFKGTCADSACTTKKLRKRRKATSVIWNYFGYKKDKIDQTHVLCQQCLPYVATTRGNTTNLFDHLHRYHTAESCTGLILKTRPYTPYLKLHPTRFPTVAQITFRTRADPL